MKRSRSAEPKWKTTRMAFWPDLPDGTTRDQWLELSGRLPAEGISHRFPTERARLARIVKVRWAAGPTCFQCGSKDFTHIAARKTYHCRDCRHQYTATSGSLLHGTHLSFKAWFAASEAVILFNSRGNGSLLTGAKLQQIVGMKTPRIYPMMRKLKEDLIQPGGGFMAQIVCTSGQRL